MLDERMMNEQMEALAEAMLSLRTREEAFLFFEDIFTIKELQAVAQRLAVARLLKKKVTYQEIADSTGASTATISRVNRSLTYGAGGYQMVLGRMKDASSQED
ncbi:MAG: TrpR-like protein YerC/YecD [Clostridia bacterium]|nr:TrpR-like protein YerC/YecD [Clostridia bacterium]